MKKILLMTFVSLAMMTFGSCSKDDEGGSSGNQEAPTLKGTLWEANQEYDMPYLGSGVIEAQLFFKTDDICRVDVDLPDAIQTLLSTLGMGTFDSGEYGYTFDGHTVVMDIRGGMELEYTGNTLVFHIPSQYASMVSSYIGGDEIVFYQQ